MGKKISVPDLFTDLLDEQNARQSGLPPVDQWQPSLNGDINIRIARDGSWYHEGSVITRAPLGILFSSILRREGDEYFLVTPEEKWRLVVDDAPFYVIAVHREVRDGQQALVFTTKTEDTVLVDNGHPLRVEVDAITGEPSPYVEVRKQLDALISRSVYYELVEMAEIRQISGSEVHGVTSMGAFFPLC